jgi:hypothetical protein
LTDELSSFGLDAAVLRELLDESKTLKQDLQVHDDSQEALGSNRAVKINGTTVKARAEYQLQGRLVLHWASSKLTLIAGTPDNPKTRIKLVFESTSSESDSETNEHLLGKLRLHAPPRDDTSETPSDPSNRFEELSSGDSEHDGTSGKRSHPLVSKLYGHGLVPVNEVTPPGSPVTAFRAQGSPITPKQKGKQRELDLEALNLPDPLLTPTRKSFLDHLRQEDSMCEDTSTDDGEVADDENARLVRPNGDSLAPSSPKRKKRRRHRRVIYIPLKSDTEFYTLLAKALQSLQELEAQQKVEFASQVQELSRTISKVASPAKSKADMYAWREIFSLWVEAQIFESARERDRGERSLEQAEERLHWFVDQVGRRKLAAQMKQKESRQALEAFLDLNITLLDLKRFIRLNEEAARKILKKHDKRTALTGTSDFPQFLQHLKASTAHEAGALTRPDLFLTDSHTLPHILLSTITETLLPVIPQLDDYTCLICGDISYRPIRLDCGHRFCLRCLVKMQTRKQDAVSRLCTLKCLLLMYLGQCPQCRSPVVMQADAHNLDTALGQFLELYFPKEVKAKAKSNEKESTQERWEAATNQILGSDERSAEKCTIS